MVEWLGSWPGALLLQRSGTAYLFVNATHILGISLALGAILPLDLRLLGLWRHVPLAVVGPFLIRTAGAGVALAVATGLWLFSVKPAEYLANPAFLAKMVVLGLALLNVAVQHRRPALARALAGGSVPAEARILAGLSALLWLCCLLAGRWIGFA
ncbi:DUF6644 family protein [Enterovirga sp.]|uniref:DUF6644 family protein n=1 Tax=Enterovirga sp. TaxID=2026350 RepID=UPI00260FACC1|nr:DUF6644 family protein [Enterovirga sp.]MDB5591475.1 hypothetical protein [Enterovirga sp.]